MPYEAFKPDYTYEMVEGVLVITDLDLGNRSVTNDIENVLLKIKANIKPFPIPKLVIYKDSMGFYDQVLHDAGRFDCFFPLQACDLPIALKRVRE